MMSSPSQVGVYQAFSGVTAALTFEQNIPPGRPYAQNGLNNAGLRYPPDVPVKFSVTDTNNG